MFGAFRPSPISLGGLLHKRHAKLNHTRKQGMRLRMRAVDDVIAAVAESGVDCKPIREAVALPKSDEMSARDKYTTFSTRAKGYRKGVHLVPKWTRLSFRTNPKGF